MISTVAQTIEITGNRDELNPLAKSATYKVFRKRSLDMVDGVPGLGLGSDKQICGE
jgi:hypothetical protein